MLLVVGGIVGYWLQKNHASKIEAAIKHLDKTLSKNNPTNTGADVPAEAPSIRPQ